MRHFLSADVAFGKNYVFYLIILRKRNIILWVKTPIQEFVAFSVIVYSDIYAKRNKIKLCILLLYKVVK